MNGKDLLLLFKDFDVTIQTKTMESLEDATLRRLKDKGLFIATLSSLALIFVICIGFLLFNNDSIYTGIALNGVISLATGLCGYYVRGSRH